VAAVNGPATVHCEYVLLSRPTGTELDTGRAPRAH
jgi:hypothetical protein